MPLTWPQWRQLQAPFLRSADPDNERQEEQKKPNKAPRKKHKDQGTTNKELKGQGHPRRNKKTRVRPKKTRRATGPLDKAAMCSRQQTAHKPGQQPSSCRA